MKLEVILIAFEVKSHSTDMIVTNNRKLCDDTNFNIIEHLWNSIILRKKEIYKTYRYNQVTMLLL